MPFIAALCASAEVVTRPAGPAPVAYPEETEQVLRWLDAPGTRLVTLEGPWTCPVGGAGAARAELEPLSRRWGEFGARGEASLARPVQRPAGAVVGLTG